MRTKVRILAAFCVGGLSVMTMPAQAWEPTKPIEIIVPAGTGGGADQMARVMQGIITKHNLSKQSVVVINKSGGAGGEGFLDVKNSKGDEHKLIITLSNLFTTPLATGIPFTWKDLTPVAMMALDEFILWVNADKPYKTTKDYIAAINSRWVAPAPNRKIRSSRSRWKKRPARR
jgi:putative tricarboxylic transport membrane protein